MPRQKPNEQTLQALFGEDAAAPALNGMLQALAGGYSAGLADTVPTSDRADILAAAIRPLRTEDMFGDCIADGDRYPCKSVRACDIVTSADA